MTGIVGNEAQLRVYVGPEVAMSTIIDKGLELGRQRVGEKQLFQRVAGQPTDRIIIAPIAETRISRSQMFIKPNDANSVRVTNISSTRAIAVEDDFLLMPGAQMTATDVWLTLENTRIHVFVPGGPAAYSVTLRDAGQGYRMPYDEARTLDDEEDHNATIRSVSKESIVGRRRERFEGQTAPQSFDRDCIVMKVNFIN